MSSQEGLFNIYDHRTTNVVDKWMDYRNDDEKGDVKFLDSKGF
jgi:hypothetical protein